MRSETCDTRTAIKRASQCAGSQPRLIHEGFNGRHSSDHAEPGNSINCPPSRLSLLRLLFPLHSHLANSQLTGAIPTEFGLFTAMEQLCALCDAQYTHEMRPFQGSPSRARAHLPTSSLARPGCYEHRSYLDGNRLSGTIPTEIGLLTAVSFLYEAPPHHAGAKADHARAGGVAFLDVLTPMCDPTSARLINLA